jgi:uncharacterized membrane protein YdjX (TVP38/TMEM64 family)
MQEWATEFFQHYREYAIFLSVILSIFIAVLGVVPTIFLTAANVTVFGFWMGMLLSFIGEALGAVVAFLLYRKGLKQRTTVKLGQYQKIGRLLDATGMEAFMLILSMRLLPFIPSGVVTFFAAIGRVSLLVFLVASTVGKVPALFMEVYSVHSVLSWSIEGKVILGIVAIVILVFMMRRKGRETE